MMISKKGVMKESCSLQVCAGQETGAEGVMKAACSLQVCAGQETGAEAAIHAVHDIFKYYTAEAVLLIDVENAFNAINRKAMLHNFCHMSYYIYLHK